MPSPLGEKPTFSFQSPEAAALPVVWCAASPDAAGRNGLYLHLTRERAVSALASDAETGERLWEAAHAALRRVEKKAQ